VRTEPELSAPTALRSTLRIALWRALLLATVAFAVASALPALLGSGLAVGLRFALAMAAFASLAAAALWWGVWLPLQTALSVLLASEQEKRQLAEERLLRHENDGRLQHALEIAEDEGAVLRIAEQAMRGMPGGMPLQLLLAPDAESEIRTSITVGEMPAPASCNIKRPGECPTVRRGQGLVYEDSMALSACPGLNGQIDVRCAAACTPIVIDGRGTGMMRALGEAGDAELFRALQSLNFYAHQVGSRLGVIRSVAASAAKAATDPLTGLANRRAMDRHLADLLARGQPFALAMADIDHFKRINDTHGHDVGDRAIKALASTLQQCARRDDAICRFGGEEFVLLLPGLDAEQAAALVERVRGDLPRAAARATVPAFTLSAGVVDHRHGSDAEALVRAADELLYRAKHEGRDRVLVASGGC
jgi:diguanylate cyclase (GGDEF)-like protein